MKRSTMTPAFTEQDVRNANKVCLIGQTLVKELFSDQSPVGKTLRINIVPMRVIGALSRKGSNVMGMDQDDVLLTPWTTLKNRVSASTLGTVNQSVLATNADGINSYGDSCPRSHIELYTTLTATQMLNTPRPQRQTTVDQITVSAVSMERIDQAVEEIQRTLIRSHRISEGEPVDLILRNLRFLNFFASSLIRVLLYWRRPLIYRDLTLSASDAALNVFSTPEPLSDARAKTNATSISV